MIEPSNFYYFFKDTAFVLRPLKFSVCHSSAMQPLKPLLVSHALGGGPL